MDPNEKIETQARREASYILARCPYRPGTPERAMWLDAMANAVRTAWLATQDYSKPPRTLAGQVTFDGGSGAVPPPPEPPANVTA